MSGSSEHHSHGPALPDCEMMDAMDVLRWIAFRDVGGPSYNADIASEAVRLALRQLIGAAFAGKVLVVASRPTIAPSGATGIRIIPSELPEQIPPTTFAAPGLTIGTDGAIRLSAGARIEHGTELPLFMAARFRKEQVLGLWPPGSPDASGVGVDHNTKPSASLPTKPVPSTRHPEHGDDFIQEMLRFALTLDGFETRNQLGRHMKDWCQQTRGDQSPSDRSIERWVRRYCPPEIPDR